MADVAKTETATIQAITEYPARLQVSMLAPVKALAAAIPAGDKEARIIGYVFGEARGVSFRNNQNSADGEPATALIGVFEGVPQYDDWEGMAETDKCSHRPRLASGVCFLPDQAQKPIVNAVLASDTSERPRDIKRGQRSDRLGLVVPVSIEIAIRKSDSPVGYEWVVRGLANVSAVNPIDRMRALMGTGPGARLALLVDKGAEQPALPAPAKSGDTPKAPKTPPASKAKKR
ncbi:MULTISPECIES: hypothetical protein [Bacillati]|nr:MULTISPECIES: hypothetical protein [Terrabacteria group]MEB2538376.1 hypothetical protein [Micrococcus luteus]MEB2597923.1 hypothetical protein [Corynebacterium amycolatum]MEB2616600.1 hypothetical protein [Bacillus cereus]MEB2620400.1 hypothetical protein [Kocuria rosea]